MTTLRIVTRGLAFHWRIHAAVALGVLAATAVLTGALVVGDSVRGSLRQLTLDRLGRIDEVLIVDRFFRREVAEQLASQPRFGELYASAVPAILFPSGTVETQDTDNLRRAAGVLVLGCEESFWKLGAAGNRPATSPRTGEIVLNAPLADELGAQIGDTLIVRLGKADQIPADSPLGRRTDRTASLAELKLIDIIPAEGLGRFSLQASQLAPRNAYVSLDDLQFALDVSGQVNAILVGGRDPERPAPSEASEALANILQPSLADLGLTLKHVQRTFGDGESAETIYEYFSLSSDRMLLERDAEQAALRAFKRYQPQRVLTYLANDIAKLPAEGDVAAVSDRLQGIPYSTITAIDPAAGGPLVDATGQPLPLLADDEIVLNSWAANDQQAKVGDRVRVTFFEPETTHGEERQTSAEFRVAAIVPLTEPASGFTRRGPAQYDERPTAANDPDLTPEVKGITDQASIDDWDAPFSFDLKRIRDQDDTYWDHHRTTPKAYVSLATGQQLWGSRFGNVTSIRIPAADGMTTESLERELLAELDTSGERLGFAFQPIKRQSLEASAGTTPFDVLFLLLSMFIIAAALMLVWLLFRLGVEQRAGEIGLLLAMGWPRAKVRRAFLLEGGLVAAAGALVGIAAGVGYAWLMIVGLSTWWVGAIASPFLDLHITPLSLAVGFVAGLAVTLLTIWFSLGRVKRAVVRSLLAGEIVAAEGSGFRVQGSGRESVVGSRGPVVGSRESGVGEGDARVGGTSRARNTRYSVLSTRHLLPPAALTIPAIILFVAAVGLTFYAATLGGEAQAGALLGAGAALLVSLLLVVIARLRSAGSRSTLVGGHPLGKLAFRSAGRNVGRSAATIALMASAAFLIVAVSAFRMSPTGRGVGGFDLLAESSQPLYHDLNSAAGRRELLADRAAALAESTVLSLRLKAGDDASCRNLYQPTQPRVLGVPPQMVRYFDDPQLPARFGWSASAAASDEERANPWRLLAKPTVAGKPVPVVIDQNTAMYSLRLYRGVGQTFAFTYDDGTRIEFQVVGLLANSVLQGSLLIGEADFQRLFPQTSGYRFFLIRTPPGQADAIASVLEDRLGDEGFDAFDARARLADLLAVQNTYISTFQSLGALGLLLGTFGLAAVQLRSVFERRKELAVMRAAGFRRRRLGEMVLLESVWLLIAGLTVGTTAALVAVLPQLLWGDAEVPLIDLAVMLGVVLVVGITTGLIAVRATLRAPLVGALRGE